MSVHRASLVASGDDPLSLLAGAGAKSVPLAAAPLSPSPATATPRPHATNGTTHTQAQPNPSHSHPSTPAASFRHTDPDDIIVDSDRARGIATRLERKEHTPLYVGTNAPPLPVRPTKTPTAGQTVPPPSSSPSPSPSPSSPHTGTKVTRRASTFKATQLPCRARDWNPSQQLTKEFLDDWDSHGRIPGEKSVMQIPDVVSYNAYDDLPSVVHSLYGTLFMTSYQLYLEPTQRRDRLGQSVQAIPLSTIDRIEIEKSRGSGSVSGSPLGPHHLLNYLDIYSKDGRFVKFGFMKFDECKRAYDCLNQYVFPLKEEYLFAFYYKIKTPIPAHLDGWNLYDPIEEFKRQGVNTIPLSAPASTQSDGLRLSWANESFTMCSSYPRVFVVPSEKFISDVELHVVAQFRSRGRIPVMTWKHPNGRQTIWRCSQPKVGMNNARCLEDERLLSAITSSGDMFGIYDARPKFNARANILAGKGFENPDLYKNCLKKIFFQNIENIHVMRGSYQTLVKACQKEVHDTQFLQQLTQSGWLAHIACVLKATCEMVKAVDQDKISLLIHCSDGWDRTAQLASLCELCLDPYYRTTKGFFVLVEKEWISFGHQFQKRTGHKDKNFSDDQRSCIFLQWADCVYQLLEQFPCHFEFNSHLLVTMVHHLYSCRFGTFFYNSDMIRRKNKIREKTMSLWTYFMCSPAAIEGVFTNQLYQRSGNGTPSEPFASASTATASGAASGVVAGVSSSASPDDDVGRSSVGRGGGDGSIHARGSVLYPSWSLKKVHLWKDYFLRFQNEQLEQVSFTMPSGSVPPGGAATTRFYSNEAITQREIRRILKENQILSSAVGIQSKRVSDLESELAALKAKYAVESNESHQTSTNDDSDHHDGNANANAPITVPSLESTSPAADGDPHDVLDDDADVDDTALAALRARLQQDVDANVVVVEEAPEDANTL